MRINRRGFMKSLGSAAVLATLTPLSGCLKGENKENEENMVKITDAFGREVEIPEKVDEIVGVGAGALRLITYIKCTDRVVGVEQFEKDDPSNRLYIHSNPELLDKPSIGPQHGGAPSLILEQDPDLVIKTNSTAKDCNTLQSNTGIPVVGVGYGDLTRTKNRLYNNLEFMGKILDKRERANEVIQYIKDTISGLEDRTKDIPEEEKPTAYIGGVNFKGSYGIRGTELAYAPFKFINAKNVAKGQGKEHIQVYKEKILQWDPDYLFVDEGGYNLVMENLRQPEFQDLTAIKEGNVYAVLPQSYYHHMHATVLSNSYYIGKIIYPDRFEDIDIKQKSNQIFEKLVGKPVYHEIKQDFGGYKKIKKPY
ncbi:MAG: ABC-type Fe(3+)-hydroxamate transport system periplasmic component [Candidatus Methanohalarchaeum thermophilum]|uniref:ABC-type Fe(3+)-hydroxamate transport system periplasmic component n=1 Tax=Methanohalarchaeum thermophilum TaxID=1903181 RepID=A0A1Q6DSF8_METT1|nr:MAG: ABC-type Fe(3+)-hydroxamate transport system periplasmic component [Candidatus Methanohalarchaeum thermophilum]